MTKFKGRLLASVSMVALLTVPAFADSSGSFTAGENTANCTINSSTGGFITGNKGSTSGTAWQISTNPLVVQANGSGQTAFIITPSAVTGLFTSNKVTATSTTSTEDIGIQVQVNVAGTTGNVVTGTIQLAPNATGDKGNTTDTGATCVAPASGAASCVIYDQRFIQVKAAFLKTLATLAKNAGLTTANLTFQLIESTLSAHSFNFYATVPNAGNYKVTAQAQLFIGKNNTSPASSVVGCFGPGTLTVEQVKNFKNDSTIQFQ